VRKFEAEIVAMAVNLLKGNEGKCVSRRGEAGKEVWRDVDPAVGLLTSGGTESILVAIHGYREKAYEQGIDAPELICCYTAHPAVDKACHYFGLKLVKVAQDSVTQQLPPAAVEKAITANTIAVYASAPTFPHGVVDPVEGLAAIVLKHRARGR
jgi:sphinganine-1-phosphate aldolase